MPTLFHPDEIVFLLANSWSEGLKGMFLVSGTFARVVGTVHWSLLSNHVPAMRIFRPSDKNLQVALFKDTSDINELST